MSLEQLHRATAGSRDKLFIIAHKARDETIAKWYVVQVDMELTNQGKARQQGKYHILWYKARELDQTSRTLRLCRYWPEIHCMRSDGVATTKGREESHRIPVAVWTALGKLWDRTAIYLY
eukprot:scaffold57935_cov64-Attheya_sp.AAC.2